MSESVRLQAFDPFFHYEECRDRLGSQPSLRPRQTIGRRDPYRLACWPRHNGHSIYLPQAFAGRFRPAAVAETVLPPSRDTSAVLIPKPGREGRRILVLDDDNQVLETVTEILSDAGYMVTPFATASQALEEVKGSEPIDLMVVDFAMPEMRGDQFATEARLRRSAVPILFISGYAEPTSLQSEPFVLRKPFSMASLISTAEEAMQIVA